MSLYIISFDIKNGTAEDYKTIHAVIRKMFPTYVSILTTTYIVRTVNSVDLVKVRDKIDDSIKKSVDIMASGATSTSAWSLTPKLSRYLKNVIYK